MSRSLPVISVPLRVKRVIPPSQPCRLLTDELSIPFRWQKVQKGIWSILMER
jgi:hypothetical protein